MAQKEYEEKLVKETEKRIKQLNRINEWLQEKGMEEVYENLSVTRKELVVPQVLPDDQYIKQWLDVEYKGRPFLDAAVSFLTEKGERVSKSIFCDFLLIPILYIIGVSVK